MLHNFNSLSVYSALLATLPHELAENSIDYRQLKKTIRQLVTELEQLGLGPEVLQSLLSDAAVRITDGSSPNQSLQQITELDNESEEHDEPLSLSPSAAPRIAYELSGRVENQIHPRLHIWLPTVPSNLDHKSPNCSTVKLRSEYTIEDINQQSLLWSLRHLTSSEPSEDWVTITSPNTMDARSPSPNRRGEFQEIIIPLASDLAFFTTLTAALDTLSVQNSTIQTSFINSLKDLTRSISQTSHPVSHATSSPHQLNIFGSAVNDLYVWREIFSLYMEHEVFESTSEHDRGERELLDTEDRLQKFVVDVGIIGSKFSKKNRQPLENFLRMNVYLLNLKKYHFANSEATRKILKKHSKRTSLPILSSKSVESLVPSLQHNSSSLPHILVTAMSEILLPVIPHLQDYECLICTSIAFKPIRLDCGHFYCVRCLVKMQKAGQNSCPMCRAPVVLRADKGNVDHALLHLMLDWFPRETKTKQKSNEKESSEEQLREMGIKPDSCNIQ